MTRSKWVHGIGGVLPLTLVGLLAVPLGRGAAAQGGGTISGTVASTDAGPLNSCSVSLLYPPTYDFSLQDPVTCPTGSTQSSFSMDLRVVNNPTGENTFRIGFSGDHHIEPSAVFTVNCRVEPPLIVCDPVAGILLSGPSAYGNIMGTVKDRLGRPPEFAELSAVEASSPFGHTYTRTTNADGSYSFGSPNLTSLLGVFVGKSGTTDYEVTVRAVVNHQLVEDTNRVTVHAAAISQVHFVLGSPGPSPMTRAQETAMGRPQGCDPRFRGKPCNVTTGNMYTEMVDLIYPAAFGPFVFSRSYNSQSSYHGPLGLGWTHPFDCEVTELGPGGIRVRYGDGSVRIYERVPASTDTYRPTAPARETSTLVKHGGGFTETEQSGLRRDFDPTGKLHAIVTRLGWRTTLTYAGDQLARVTDPGGRTLAFAYTGGFLTRVDGPGGLFVEHGYDAQGRLIEVKDALGVRWTYAYTGTTPSLLASARDATGNPVEEHTYDPQGRIIASTGADRVGALTFEYPDVGHTRVADSLGRVTTYTFGNFGDQWRITQIQGPCPCGTPDTRFEYDSVGQLIAQTDARGSTTRFEYDADGNLIRITDPLGNVTTAAYNAFGQVLTTTDPTGATTSFTYDETTGFLRQVTNALHQVTTVTPDAQNLPGAVTNPLGQTTTVTYAETGLPSAMTDPTGAAATLTYDAAGRLLATADPLGGTVRYTYDGRGRLRTLTDPIGAVTEFGYDAAGNRISFTDPNGRVTTTTYDAASRPIQVTDPAGGTTAYTYDTEGNVLTVTDAKGNATSFAYDAHNRLVARTDPLGASETFTYDAVGNLATRTDRKGQTLGYASDALNRLTEKTLPDGTSVRYTYDALGRLRSATDANGPLTFAYDALGRLRTATSQDGRTLAYTYDAAGNRASLQDETGRLTTYGYDPRNLVTALTDPRTGPFAFQHDAAGRRARLTRPNGTATTYTYDPATRLTALTHTGPTGPIEGLSYSYDPAGNRTADRRNATARQYTYDPLHQLTAVQQQDQSGQVLAEATYTYDAAGNRLTGPTRRAYAYDTANRLTADTTRTFAYDANGNLVERRNTVTGLLTTYTYDAEDRLIRVVRPQTEVTFQYDPLGRRTEKQVLRWEDADGDGEPDPDKEVPPRVIRYLYDQEDLLATFDDAGQEIARYTHGPGIDEPLAEVRPDRTRFYHADVLGSILALTDPRGRATRAYQYAAFGAPEDHRADPQPYRFTAREWDREAGLYYYRARYYAPRLGRFLTEDRFQRTKPSHLYPYVGSNPTTLVDPLGLFQARRVIKGAASLGGGIGALVLTAALGGGSGGLAAPAVVVGIHMSATGMGYGVYEIVRGIVEPSTSTARDIPTPYPGTLVVIIATGGDVETASTINNILNDLGLLGRGLQVGAGVEFTDRQLVGFLLDALKFYSSDVPNLQFEFPGKSDPKVCPRR
jgi:RHS repeat-associated protein